MFCNRSYPVQGGKITDAHADLQEDVADVQAYQDSIDEQIAEQEQIAEYEREQIELEKLQAEEARQREHELGQQTSYGPGHDQWKEHAERVAERYWNEWYQTAEYSTTGDHAEESYEATANKNIVDKTGDDYAYDAYEATADENIVDHTGDHHAWPVATQDERWKYGNEEERAYDTGRDTKCVSHY